MNLQRTSRYMVAAFAGVLFTFSANGALAQTSLISNEQIENQKIAVMVSLVETLRQDLKLLQMHYIQNLEKRVEYLKSLVSK